MSADFEKAIKALRRRRGSERIAVFPDSTVVRFNRIYTNGPRHAYTYAAVWIQATQLWYITGAPEGDGIEIYRHTAFLDLMADSQVTAVQVATGWETV
jgi:hypothetical protein